ncbi:FecR domain-containing protein [Verrucomicrobiaceae bacterium N1E253]|uniref:FecR domain-containing protein n=1 Tax=Oceaniferula marina TaxID=2748318 RepID=A0A851GBS5_9BACT|nr:LamG-like jellyroll fold domain-containing protein [Oceaniferula marina]NWK55053.1 FecR domain-containing protein [Oceaniferula marina]
MNQEELTSLIEAWLDHTISESELTRLKQELLANRESVEYYVELAEMHSLLSQAKTTTLPQTNVVPMERVLKRQKNKTIKIALISAAAILVLSAVLMRLFFVDPETPPSLAFQTSPGTLFTITHDGAEDQSNGQTMHPGSRLQLSQGAIELNFASGVKSIITAPADLTLHANDRLYLGEGTGWFHVPKGAEGFQVKTRDLNIVDLGTEFGVLAKTNDHDEVHVLKGKVQVTTLRIRKESATLTAGQARRIDPIGRLSTIPSANNQFANKLPKSLPYLHWSFDEIEDLAFPAEGTIHCLSDPSARPIKNDTKALTMLGEGRFESALSIEPLVGKSLLTGYPGIAGDRPRTIAFWYRSERIPSGGVSGIVTWGRFDLDRKSSLKSYQDLERWTINISGDESHTGRGKVQIIGTGYLVGGSNVCDGQWHHIACSYRSTEDGVPETTLFIDGKKEPLSADYPQSIPNSVINTLDPNASPVAIGHNADGVNPKKDFKIQIDELYIFEGTLSEKSILRLMHTNSLK